MLVFRAGIHKMLVRIANREDPYQTASSEAARVDPDDRSRQGVRTHPHWKIISAISIGISIRNSVAPGL